MRTEAKCMLYYIFKVTNLPLLSAALDRFGGR
jgi:hypothetical protein